MTKEQLEKAKDLRERINYLQQHKDCVKSAPIDERYSPDALMQDWIITSLIDMEEYRSRVDGLIADLEKEFEAL